MKLAVLMTSFNRKDKTLGCLRSLFAQEYPDVELSVFLVDDASSDGTANAVRAAFPAVRVLAGSGNLYWNGGMRVAIEKASRMDFDFHLWLNDDTDLFPDALQRLIVTSTRKRAETGKPVVVVGATCDSRSKRVTYGGARRVNAWNPMKLITMAPGSEALRCDTFNGNCVLIPSEIVESLGNLDSRFAHAMGDTDYGMRALKAGFELWLVPGFVGHCSIDHPVKGTYRDRSLSLRARWRHMMSPKGMPPSSWRALTRRHGGPLWVLFWLWPYARVIIEGTLRIGATEETSGRSGAGA